MGHSVYHGRRLYKQRLRYEDGIERDELEIEDGESTNISYSSMARIVEFCAARGVSKEDWPIYTELWDGDVDLAEVAARCERLREALKKIPKDEGSEITWFWTIREWLEGGEQFAAFD